MNNFFLPILSVVTVVAMFGCVSSQDRPLSQTCNVLAVYEESPFITVERDDRDTMSDCRWPAMAVVVETASGGPTSPATLFLLARPGKTELTANDVVGFSRLAFPCSSIGVRGRWIVGEGHPVFLMAFASGGTGGDRIVAFAHKTIWTWSSPPLQQHYFYQILDTQSRMPILLVDVDGDGFPELLVATEETNCSNTELEDNPKMYRVIRIADNSGDLIKEIHRDEVHQFKSIEEF